MKILRSFAELHALGNSCLAYTVGNFDGLHLGHREIVSSLVSLAKQKGCVSCVVSFIRHTSSVFHDRDEALRLLDNEERAEILKVWGVDILLEIDFDDYLVSLTARQFLDLLWKKRDKVHFVVGEDFCFGKGKIGNVEFIEQYLQDRAGSVAVISDLESGGARISSSRIRDLLTKGDVEQVSLIMGRIYAVRGAHVSGHRIGRRLGFPTINLGSVSAFLPGDGVYKTETLIAGTLYKSMTYLGRRPTFNGEEHVFETNLFGYQGASPIGEKVTVYFKRFLRADRKFETEEELVLQLAKDRDAALEE